MTTEDHATPDAAPQTESPEIPATDTAPAVPDMPSELIEPSIAPAATKPASAGGWFWGTGRRKAAVARVRASDRERFVRTLGLIGLVVFLSGITVIKLSTEERIVVPKQSQPSIETPLRSLWPDAWKARWADDTAGPGAGNDAGD